MSSILVNFLLVVEFPDGAETAFWTAGKKTEYKNWFWEHKWGSLPVNYTYWEVPTEEPDYEELRGTEHHGWGGHHWSRHNHHKHDDGKAGY